MQVNSNKRINVLASFFIAGLCLALNSCQKKEQNSARSYASIVPEGNKTDETVKKGKTGLVQKIQVGDLQMSVAYKSSNDLLRPTSDQKRLAKMKSEFDKNYYFILNISYRNEAEITSKVGSAEEYNSLQDILSNRLGDYVKLVSDHTKKLKLVGFHSPRTYGFSRSNEIILVFEKPELPVKKTLEIIIDEFGLGIGAQRFLFNIDEINQTT
jgi:hypothetical protein